MLRANSFELPAANFFVENTSLSGNVFLIDFKATTDHVISLLVVDIWIPVYKSVLREFMAPTHIVVRREAPMKAR